jgi:trigger factor
LSPAEAENTVAENPEEQPAVAIAEEEALSDGMPPDGMNEACRREISIEIPADIVNKQWDTTTGRYSREARVAGFRTGKVPASVIRNRFGKEIKQHVLEALLPEYFRNSVAQQGFLPVSEPQVLELQMEQGQPLRFKAAFEVLPEFELLDYQEFKVEKPSITLEEAEVEAELKGLQEQRASYDPMEEDRALQDGDFAQVSLKATLADASAGEAPAAESQPVDMDEALVEIGGANTIPEFSENLRGAKPGEERTFAVTYPEDQKDQRLAGKTFSYTTKINAIKKKTTPELNDAFAKELSQEFETLDDLRRRMREGMQQEREHKAEHEAKTALLAQVVEKYGFPVPETLVQHQLDIRLKQFVRRLAAQGMRTEDMQRMDFRRMRASMRSIAAGEVKSNLVLEKIAALEKIEATEEDLGFQIQMMAQQSQQTAEAVHMHLMKDGGIDHLKNQIRSEKALTLLYTRASGGESGPTAVERKK